MIMPESEPASPSAVVVIDSPRTSRPVMGLAYHDCRQPCPLGLRIGQLVFRALNAVELALAATLGLGHIRRLQGRSVDPL